MKRSDKGIQSLIKLMGLFVLACACGFNAQAGHEDRDEIKSTVALTRTEAAPETARGKARFDARRSGDSVSGRIKLEVINLVPGTYTVTLMDGSGGSTVLGDLAVKDKGGDDSSSDDGHDNKSKADFKFDSVDPLTVTAISIADETGLEMLTGDLSTGMQDVHVKARAVIVGTDAAPDVEGRIDIHGHMKRGKQSGHFHLKAKGFPPETAVIISIDGVDAINATTDDDGDLHIHRKADEVNLFSLSTISIRDELGVELANAEF